MKRLTARDIDRHMRTIGPYVDWSSTCDTFKNGDPDTAVAGIAVSWMSTTAALREAHARGCNVFITHEPTFYSHMDDDPAFESDESVQAKRRFLDETSMVVYRCHDVWDRFPGYGILDSWTAYLGLDGNAVASETFMRVLSISAQTVRALAHEVARRIKPLGQEAVQLVGDPDRTVSRVGIGTGAITSIRDYRRMRADAGIVTELIWWRDARWALDVGIPFIVVDHTVSEEPGIVNLAAYLRRQYPGLRVEYIPTHCPFRLVGTSAEP